MTGTANSLNISQQGIVYFDGISIFSGIDGSTVGKVLTSNGTGVSPSFQTPTNAMLIMKSANINFKVTGATTIFTPVSDFVVIGVTAYAVTLTGAIAGVTANLGWTAAAYDNIISGYTAFPTNASGDFINNMTLTGSEVSTVPAGTPFKINITSADGTATVNTQRIDIIGYYL